jgi:hypothetical protein
MLDSFTCSRSMSCSLLILQQVVFLLSSNNSCLPDYQLGCSLVAAVFTVL